MNFQPQFSTPDVSTPDFSTMNSSAPDFSEMNLELKCPPPPRSESQNFKLLLKILGLKSPWLKNLGLKSPGLKCPATPRLQIYQPQTFQTQASTPEPQLYVVLKSLRLKIPGLNSSWLKSLGLKNSWLKNLGLKSP